MKWNSDNTITVDPPRRPKKVTGTRFAAIMGKNLWSTPFEAWCAITRTYEEPFVDTKYTIAGKAIEPKQAEYIAREFFWERLLTPTDKYGEDFFQKTYGDFFPDNKILGGMWDYLFVDKDGNPTTVLEMKTTKRAEDWIDDVPEYYALQAALYAWLLGVDDVMMVCTILEDSDYDHSENFVPGKDNTFVRQFKVSERYPDFDKLVKQVERWWKKHVIGGVSPEYDEKKDAEILKELRKNNLNPTTDLEKLIDEAETLQTRLSAFAAEMKDDEDRLKVLKDQIKEASKEQFREGDKEVVLSGKAYNWVTSRSVSLKIDEAAMKKDGILDKYKTKEVVTLRLMPKKKGEEND